MQGLSLILIILGGKPIIKGARVPVELVLGKLAGGMTQDEVMYEYYLSTGVRAALGYAEQQVAQKSKNRPKNCVR